MIEEQDIIFDESPKDLIKILIKEGSIDESDQKDYKIIYFGERDPPEYLESLLNNFPIDEDNLKEIQSHLKNVEDSRNYILYIKYKNMYIGGLSILDFQSKEGFGLYKYLKSPDNAFYLGQWSMNVKSGIGFLKIDKNHLYIGNFNNNQMEGEGFYHNKQNDNYYFGLFSNNIFKKGLYCNLQKDIYYIGKFENNKKNDNFCIFFNYKKHRLFLGQIKNDIFIKGYIAILKLKETTNDIILKIKNVIYKDNEEYSEVDIKHDNNLETLIYKIPQIINNLQVILNNVYISLLDKEKIYDDNTYNLRLGRYNSTENAFSFEKELIDNYNKYTNMLKDIEIYVKKMKSKISI